VIYGVYINLRQCRVFAAAIHNFYSNNMNVVKNELFNL
jgi:hypothetical protein